MSHGPAAALIEEEVEAGTPALVEPAHAASANVNVVVSAAHRSLMRLPVYQLGRGWYW